MKAIIIAAGMGRRMRALGLPMPKCMLDLKGKTLLEMHFETLRACGINDISVIKGFMADKIQFPGVKYYINDRYESNNILNSLFYANDEMNDDVIISYCDIFYQKEILDVLVASKHEISIAVDLAWRSSYARRSEHPIEEAENVKIGSDKKVLRIGKNIDKETADAEFIGMIKLSKRGCEVFKEMFNASKKRFSGRPFHEAFTFEKAYLTDMIQEIADNNIDVHCIAVEGGWKEVDTLQDYQNLKEFLKLI